MMNLNTIHTDAEYMAQGFEEWELPLIRKHDELFNQHQLEGDWNEIPEDDEYFKLVEILKL